MVEFAVEVLGRLLLHTSMTQGGSSMHWWVSAVVGAALRAVVGSAAIDLGIGVQGGGVVGGGR
jgi:hypothetical protein